MYLCQFVEEVRQNLTFIVCALDVATCIISCILRTKYSWQQLKTENQGTGKVLHGLTKGKKNQDYRRIDHLQI